MTSFESEMAEQGRWRLRPKYAGFGLFDRLVANEFLSLERQVGWQRQAISSLVRYAAERVPYYRRLLRDLGLSPDDIRGPRDLPRLPPLTKSVVCDRGEELLSEALPRGERRLGYFSSSGTTGRPAKVLHTASSNEMFSYLNQRQLRWFRFDPAKTYAVIRLASQLPRRRGSATLNPDGETLCMAQWRYVGRFFETGPYVCFNVTNPVERQLAWLAEHRPAYLMTYSETLEHLAFAAADERPADSLEGLFAISEQLTASMRRRVERVFGTTVHQNYGLNEVGQVAVRCAAGRYHVHTEHCHVEIADDDGQPRAPGEVGRILVTAFRNPAMPLIRYDTGDLAEAVDGPCPCGRTLPAFGEIAGRYSRIAFLPEGTLGYVAAVREALETMPIEHSRPLRRFQIHQYRDNSFELRLVAAGSMPAEFHRIVRQAWRSAVGERGYPLDIVEVEQIARGPGGKFQDFTSDYFPAPGDPENAPEGPAGADGAQPPPMGSGT